MSSNRCFCFVDSCSITSEYFFKESLDLTEILSMPELKADSIVLSYCSEDVRIPDILCAAYQALSHSKNGILKILSRQGALLKSPREDLEECVNRLSNNGEKVRFSLIKEENFFREAYYGFSVEEMEILKEALCNVYDYVYFEVAVGEGNGSIPSEEIPALGLLRKKNSIKKQSNSIISLIAEPLLQKQKLAENKIFKRMDFSVNNILMQIDSLSNMISNQRETIQNLTNTVTVLVEELGKLTSAPDPCIRVDSRVDSISELIAFHLSNNKDASPQPVNPAILEKYGSFFAHVRSRNEFLEKKREFTLSHVLSSKDCYSYEVETSQKSLRILAIAPLGALLECEMVFDNKIVGNCILQIKEDGVLAIPVDPDWDIFTVNFRATNTHDPIQLVELCHPKFKQQNKRELATY